ncbi:MAG: geranylgeranyl reductase family protein [Deltaproteobacteria bacterium]|nr:geranylgeranyl reductase family protein [Deltaproteobacteria bacterium]
MIYDVIVSGLGPAGAAAAYDLASRGLKVLAFDKEKFPRYKPCGGCVSLKVEKILPFDFKAVVEDTVYGAIFTYRSRRSLPILSQKVIGYNVSRDRFDNLLKEKAKEAGADIREGEKITAVAEAGDSIDIKTSQGLYKTKILIGADGANGFVGREVLELDAKACAVAIEAEISFDKGKLGALKGKLLIDFGCIPHGYAWVFPKANSLSVGIAGLSKKVKGRVKRYFADFVQKEKSLSQATISSMHGWTIPYFNDTMQRIVKGRILAVGDAAHLVDPFLGEGIYYAIRSGQLAAKVISERINDDKIDLSRYNEAVAAELYPELEAAAKVGNWVYNYPRLWYRILESEPSLMEKYYNVVRGEESYKEFYAAIVSRVKAKPWRLIVRWVKGCFSAAN